MRQFGLYQDIPPPVPRCIDEETHKMSNMGRSGVDWNAENIQWINQWNNEALQNIVPQQRTYDATTTEAYYNWLADAARDLVHACLYAALLLVGCAFISTAWFELCRYSRRYVSRLVGERVRVTPAQADSIPASRCKGRVVTVAFTVGLCVGALTLLAGFIGVSGSGIGIMLVVTGIYSSYLDARASSGVEAIGL
ncbi:Protein transport protein Sec61 subunit alpha [Hordeum vulgare]|nr:Protein transport protein Sec61 subunit alpha [Hordeum vulgare]